MSLRVSKIGFTLTELMVVIVIVAILSAVAVPMYNKYIANSRTSEAYAILADIAKSEIVFFSENSYFLPLYRNPEGFPQNKFFEISVVGWSQGWGGPWIKSPLADDTHLNFSFAVTSGNESGQFNLGSWSDLTAPPPTDIALSEPSGIFFDGGKESQSCVSAVTSGSIGSELAPENIGVSSSQPNHWAILLAQGDIFGNNQCRYLYSMVKSVNNGNAGMEGGFVLIDRDYGSE